MKIKPGTPLRALLRFAPDRRLNVGRLAIDAHGRVALEYSREFIASRFTLNPYHGMPAMGLIWPQAPRVFQGLHGFIGDSLPDAWGETLIRRRSEAQGVPYSSLTALDKLAIVGARGPGALVFEPEVPDERIDGIDLDLLADEAVAVFEGRETEVLPQLERLGGSSGGARPKVLVAMNEAGHIVPGDADIPENYEAWLVKFRSSQMDANDIGPLEAAYADMARAAGLDMSPTRLIQTGRGPGYFATKRFDRHAGNVRSHIGSVAGMLDMDWDGPGIGYDQLMKLTRHVTRNQDAVERMFSRMVFNVVAHNRDDHAKQHSFIMDATGKWDLAPAYDLVFSLGVNGVHYMDVAGAAGDDITVAKMEALAIKHDISRSHIREVIDRVSDAVERFPEFAQTYGVTQRTRSEVRRVLLFRAARL